jgi:hypothetical protein
MNECGVQVKITQSLARKAIELRSIDPCGDPIETLTRLSCKYTCFLLAKQAAEAHIVRNILYNLYAIYSTKLSIVVDEATMEKGVRVALVRSRGCKAKAKIITDENHGNIIIVVDGCDVNYTCTCKTSNS